MLVAPHALPRLILVGSGVTQAQSLTLEVHDDEAAASTSELTPTVGTLTLYDGAAKLLDAVAVTAGAPSTYSLAAVSVTSQGLSEGGLEVWRMTVAGVIHEFTRPCMFVRRVYRPTIIDEDLINGRHYNLNNIRPDALTSWAGYRREADNWIQERMIAKGRRPWLVFDSSRLRTAHIHRTLGNIFRDASSWIGDGRYDALAKQYVGEDGESGSATAAFESANFRYDAHESGTIDTEELVTAVPAIVLSAGPTTGPQYDRAQWRQLQSGYRSRYG